MKKLLIYAMCILSLTFITGCANEELTENALVGSWKFITITEYATYLNATRSSTYYCAGTLHLLKDGTGNLFSHEGGCIIEEEKNLSIRWFLRKNRLELITIDNDVLVYTIESLKGTTLILSESFGDESEQYRYEYRLEKY